MTPKPERKKRTTSALNKSISAPNCNNSFFGSINGGDPPRYLQPTESAQVKNESQQRKRANLNKTVIATASQPAWKPNSTVDTTLEKDHVKKLHNPK
jgi:hypothetical protein